MSNEFMLTTIDNPFNPFTQFDEWFVFDSQNKYNTCGLLAIYANTSNDLDQKDNDLELQDAMKQIVDMFNGKIYKIVTKDDFSTS